MSCSSGQVKSCLEKWRDLVVLADGILGWEKDFYPAISAGITTFLFLFVWYMDMTLLTIVATTGIAFSLADYVGPKVMDKVFKPENWNAEKEKKFESACNDLSSLGATVCAVLGAVRDAKSQKPMLHFLGTVLGFCLLAWVGNRVNNFFLLYLACLVVVMLPGLHRKGLLKKYFSQVVLKVNEAVKGKEAMKKAE